MPGHVDLGQGEEGPVEVLDPPGLVVARKAIGSDQSPRCCRLSCIRAAG